MAEAAATETDIFEQQKKTIDTLIDVLANQGTANPQIVYTQPAEQTQQKTPNYILYIAIGLGVIIFLLWRK
jgi:hypothetical protein